MKIRKFNKFDMLIVEWFDIKQNPKWQSEEEINNDCPVPIREIGFFIGYEGKRPSHHIKIAHSVADDGDSDSSLIPLDTIFFIDNLSENIQWYSCAFNNLLAHYKWHAKRRSLPFELSVKEFKKLTRDNCFYCDESPSLVYKQSKGRIKYYYTGIDRIDSSKGYSIDNCVSCCKKCNRMKGDLTQEEFFEQLKKIESFQQTKRKVK